MPVSGEIAVTPELYRSVLKAIAHKLLRNQRILGAGGIVLGILLLLTGEADVRGVAIGIIAAGLLVLIVMPGRALSLSVTRAAPALTAPWRYEISADTVRLTTPLATTEWAWDSLVSFDDHPDFWLLRTQVKNTAVAVIKAAFSPVDQQAIATLGASKFTGTGTVTR